MDIAYNQHSDRARRKNRSATSLNHLTLAPLTIKLPIEDEEEILNSSTTTSQRTTSYLQGKSAPTTPRLLSRSPAGPRSRSHHRTPSAPDESIAKSKSSSHLPGRPSRSGATTPKRRKDESLERTDSDWVLRTGALMSNEAREYKGQNWLVSRQSSTSLAGLRDAEEDAFEAELAREREITSRMASRRGSLAVESPEASAPVSRYASRTHSRSHSLAAGVRSRVHTPGERHFAGDGYFAMHEPVSGPDFVNLDSKLEELEQDTTQEDEATVRRLVRREQAGKGSWIGNVVGWSLFSVDEHEEGSDDDGDDDSTGEGSSQPGKGTWSPRHFEGTSNTPDQSVPPPKSDEGAWKDAAWLLSVASKVIF